MNGQPSAAQSAREEVDAASEHAAGPAAESAAAGRTEAVADAGAGSPATDADAATDADTLPASPSDDPAAHEPATIPEDMAAGPFGTTLEPVLRRACEDRLSEVSWFRTDWQRGGALTGTASYLDDAGQPHPVVVKLPVPPCERQWLAALQCDPPAHSDATEAEAEPGALAPVVPRLYAHGAALNGYDLAWVVMEQLPHGPLGSEWAGREFDLLVEAVGRFYAAAEAFPVTGEPQQRDWPALFERARQVVRDKAVPEPQRWSKALKKAQGRLKEWAALWEERPAAGWCHGDLHLANALTRVAAPEGPALLIDFARTRVGHWLEDAVYFEHLYWARPARLDGRKLCRQIAQERKRRGLPVDPDWARLAEAKRGLLAATTPAQLRFDGDPHHLAAALAILERLVK